MSTGSERKRKWRHNNDRYTCDRKVAFETEEAAAAVIAVLAEKGDTVRSYKCPVGDHLHLSSWDSRDSRREQAVSDDVGRGGAVTASG